MFVLNDLRFDCLWSSQIFLVNNLASGLGFILSLAVSASIVNSVRRFCSSNVFPGARHLPFHLVLLFTHIIFELLLLRMHVSLTCQTTWHNRGRVPGAPRILFPFRLPSLSFTGRLLSRMLRDEAWRQTPLRKCSFILLEADTFSALTSQDPLPIESGTQLLFHPSSSVRSGDRGAAGLLRHTGMAGEKRICPRRGAGVSPPTLLLV